MAKKCIECGKRKGLFAVNYAGFDVRIKGAHPYPERVTHLVLPGDKKSDFLCVNCANKRQVVCTSHGNIPGRINKGVAPKCEKCSKEKQSKQSQEEIRSALNEVKGLLGMADKDLIYIWFRCHNAAKKTGDDSKPFQSLRGQAFLWESCCYLCAAENTKFARRVNQHWGVTTVHDAEPLWHAAAAKAKELARTATGLSPDLQELSKQVVSRAEIVEKITLQDAASLPGYRMLEQHVTGGGPLSPGYVLLADEEAILASQLKAPDLDCFIRSLGGWDLLVQDI
ncbi:MAG: hypothetical protein NT096_10895 [Proteobacteria bacterium]|nr:hypothetical protein [Pseudomonadota bacterium]